MTKKNLTAEELRPMFINHIDVPPARLFWQCGDEGPKPLEESIQARGAREFLGGTPIEETCYAKAGLRLSGVTQGNPYAFGELIRSMCNEGWRENAPRIRAWINRRGEIVLTDGMHRSAAALVAGLETIPCSIVARDEDWWALKHALAKLNNGCKLYQPIDHPDLAWPSHRRDTGGRVRAIWGKIAGCGFRTIIDVGCHSGAVSLGLLDAAIHAYQYQADPEPQPPPLVVGFDIKIEAVVAALRWAKVRCVRGDTDPLTSKSGTALFHHGEAREMSYEMPRPRCLLALSVFNHRLKRDPDSAPALFESWLELAQLIIFDCPSPGDPVGGDLWFSDPRKLLAWVGERFLGEGGVIAERGAVLQRTLLWWRRS